MSTDSNDICITENTTKMWWIRENKTYAILLAIFLIILSMCLSGMIRGSFPFGDISRSVNDLGNQFVPIHTYYWDMLHGKAEGDLFFNWRSAFGTGFYADFVTYLSSPFALLITFFPRENVNLAVYVISVAKLATAGAVMAFYLSIWKRGSWVYSGLLGASYALCGWAIDDAAFVPMWLDGLIAFPLLCLVGHWALQGKHIFLGTTFVAFAWISNFYTAYMATLGALLVILVRMFTEKYTAQQRGMTVLRGFSMVGCGVGVAMPLILPILKATSIAQPTLTKPFVAVPWLQVLSRLFPITEGIGLSPSIFVGTPALIFAIAFVFHKSIKLHIRVIWTISTILVLFSFQWNPTQLLWHAFAAPNGSSYREAFVFCGIVIMLAWQFLQKQKAIPIFPIIGAMLIYLLLMVITRKSPLLTPITFPVVGMVVFATIGAWILLTYQKKKLLFSGFAISLILIAFVAESSISSVKIDQIRYSRFTSSPEWGNWHDRVQSQVTIHNRWPQYRTETGTNFITKNDPLLLGGQGIVYYSSLTMKDTTKMAKNLGFGWDRWGRGLLSMENEVTDAIFAIRARIIATSPSDSTMNISTKKQSAAPLVTVHANIQKANQQTNVFTNHERFIGSNVYQIPKSSLTLSKNTAPVTRTATSYKLSAQTNKKVGTYMLQATCKPGSLVYLHAPNFYGKAQLLSQKDVHIKGSQASILAPIHKLGKTPASGKVFVTIKTYRAGMIPKSSLACLDQDKLQTAVKKLQNTGATSIQAAGHTIQATLPKGSKGSAVISIPNAPGWMCSLGNQKAQQPDSFMGFIRIDLDKNTQTVKCQYRPPGLKIGLLIGFLSILTCILFGWWIKKQSFKVESDKKVTNST